MKVQKLLCWFLVGVMCLSYVNIAFAEPRYAIAPGMCEVCGGDCRFVRSRDYNQEIIIEEKVVDDRTYSRRCWLKIDTYQCLSCGHEQEERHYYYTPWEDTTNG